ncbi:MAG TPA: hypothetical protein VIX14_09020 [Terriglobales bacterium]
MDDLLEEDFWTILFIRTSFVAMVGLALQDLSLSLVTVGVFSVFMTNHTP